jgi:hypothetical protein
MRKLKKSAAGTRRPGKSAACGRDRGVQDRAGRSEAAGLLGHAKLVLSIIERQER